MEWLDLDHDAVLELCCSQMQSNNVGSFAVRFNTLHSQCTLNLCHQNVDALLQAANQSDSPQDTRWFNFWESDGDTIELIARHYGMSPRLTALLCSGHRHRVRKSMGEASSKGRISTSDYVDLEPSRNIEPDLEMAAVSRTSPDVHNKSTDGAKSLDFDDVVKNLWHFCSVDRTAQYLYVGFNSLFTMPEIGIETSRTVQSDKPKGLRIWTSLLLCYDGTVVSVFEKPPPTTPPEYISIMRRNALNTFRHLSNAHVSTAADSLMQVSIRPCSGRVGQASITDADSAALVFYYLFDDWVTTYNLITRRTHPYRDKLDDIRQDLFETADIRLIKSLDLVGRQLSVLLLMYQSYELIICRILENHSKREGTELEKSSGSNDALPRNRCSGHPSRSLPMTTTVRFERLLDRVRQYALTDLEACLKEKESLALMNINLVTLKESQAMEKLTRTTILLAKVTILFLPVSLMTGYFSIQLTEITKLYSLKTYWLSFSVVVVVSIIGLVIFDIMTGSVRARSSYESLTRASVGHARGNKAKWS